ncbi:MAG: hypothetical protein RBS43_00750 [Candidatus Cloacimonas sp.]|nr:hypothetical protein [Candidatus Cloacimonas sp.]
MEDIEVLHKWNRLVQWCSDINEIQNEVSVLPLFIKEKDFAKYKPATFSEVIMLYQKHQGE